MSDKTVRQGDNASHTEFDLKYHDNGDSTYSPVVHLDATVDLTGADVEIGAVELKDGATDTRAKIGAGTALVEGDNALAVRDPKANTSLATIVTSLATLLTQTDGLEGFTDGIEANQATQHTDLVNLLTQLVVAAGENHIGSVGGSKARVAVEKTRPADTTAYTAKDNISESTSAPTVWTFTNIARVNQGSGYITKATLLTDQTTNTESFRLHLFNTAPTAINDNASESKGSWKCLV